jgi:septal ring factor EnvC (AmiA/AmiB activator)
MLGAEDFTDKGERWLMNNKKTMLIVAFAMCVCFIGFQQYQIVKLRAVINSVQRQVDSIDISEISGLKSDIAENSTDIDEIKTSVDNLEINSDDTDTKIENINNELIRLDRKIDNIESYLETLSLRNTYQEQFFSMP